MQYDPRRRVYVNADGSLVSPRELRKRIDAYVKSEQTQVDKQAQRMRAGEITVAAFFAWLAAKIHEVHGAAAIAAHGGPENMTAEDWARVGEKIQFQLNYLKKFQAETAAAEQAAESLARRAAVSADVPAGLETVVEERVKAGLMANSVSDAAQVIRDSVQGAIADTVGTEEAASVAKGVADAITTSDRLKDLIFGQVPARSRMYVDAYDTYENSLKTLEQQSGAVGVRRVCEEDERSCDECVAAASEEYQDFADVPDIGTLTCMDNCRCSFEFDYQGIEPLTIDRNIYA